MHWYQAPTNHGTSGALILDPHTHGSSCALVPGSHKPWYRWCTHLSVCAFLLPLTRTLEMAGRGSSIPLSACPRHWVGMSTPFYTIALNLVSNSWRRWFRNGRNTKLRRYISVCLHVVSRCLPQRIGVDITVTVPAMLTISNIDLTVLCIYNLSDFNNDVLYQIDFFVGPENTLRRNAVQLAEAYGVLKTCTDSLECRV